MFPRMGGKRLFERDQFPGGYKMFIENHNELRKPSRLGPQ